VYLKEEVVKRAHVAQEHALLHLLHPFTQSNDFQHIGLLIHQGDV
jgi:hypothetical protein